MSQIEKLKENLEKREEELEELKDNLEKSEELNKKMFLKLENKVALLTQENKELKEDIKSLLNQLVRSDRMIATGSIAMGIAREFNNMLVGPQICAQSYLEEDLAEELKEILKDLIITCEAGEKLLSLLLGGPVVRDMAEKTDINAIIEDIIILMSPLFERDKIDIIKNYGTIPEIEVKEEKAREAFVNIILNSRDLIKSVYEKGQITINTICDGETVRIEIFDTGEGIAKECLKDIFNPEAIIRGAKRKQILPRMGHGLSGAYEIIEEHGGTMEVESLEGEGSKFIIWLPLKVKKESEE